MHCDSALKRGNALDEEENAGIVTQRVTATMSDMTLQVMDCDFALMMGDDIQQWVRAGNVTRRVTATIVDITLRVMNCDFALTNGIDHRLLKTHKTEGLRHSE